MNNREIATICYYSTILIILGLVECSSGESIICTKMVNTVVCENAKGNLLQKIESKNIKIIKFLNCSLTYLCEQGFSKFTDVRGILIDECKVPYNALTCILTLPQLTALQITNSNIVEKHFTALKSDSSLVTLSLKGNKMHHIDKSSFKHLLHLEEIDLSHNKISTIRANAFQVFPALRKLNISYNRLKGAFSNIFGKEVFDNISRLEEIDLSHNEISTIEPDAFQGFPALRKLDISYNRLKGTFNNIFRKGVFDNLWSVEELDLSHNEMSKIRPDAFKGLSALRKLDLSGNRLSGDFNPSALGLSVHCVFQSLVVIWPGAGKLSYPSERNLYSAPHATTVDPQQGQGQRKEQQRKLEVQQDTGSRRGREGEVEGEVDREGTVVDATGDSVKGDSGGGLSVGRVRAVLLFALALSMLIFF